MRKKWRLHQGWFFREADVAESLLINGPDKQPGKWQAVTVPHTFRLEPYAHRGVTTAQGIGTYINYFPLDKTLENKNIFLTFEAVMGVSEVWLNDTLLYTNYGGYLPFVVNLSEAARFDGKENQLVVRANNQDDGQVPPGKPQELLDFTYFGGMYRDVWLEATDDIFITDAIYEQQENKGGIILEYPYVSKEKADVLVRVELRSTKTQETSFSLIYRIIDSNNNEIFCEHQQGNILANETNEFSKKIAIDSPKLWYLEDPSLYRLEVSVRMGNQLIDQKTLRFGLRKIQVDRTKGVLINDEVQPFLSGVNRHQDYPVIGNAAPASLQRRDALLFKEAGFQVVRGAHYPMSEAFLDACDELGLLVFEATPGWQWYPTNNPEPFASRVRENIRQMVRRNRNHPCILAYETVLNETYHVPHGFSKESALAALAEQPDAKVSAESYGYDASPEANGIDKEAEFVYGFQDPLEKTERAVMFLREYTDSYIEYYGKFHSRRVTRGTTDGFYPHGEARNLVKANQMLFRNLPEDYSLARCYQIQNENPAFVGAAIWTGIDSRGAGSLMSPCGIWDGYRLPKTAYWAYASQQDKKTVLHIASEWTETAPLLDKSEEPTLIGSDALREIYVYSNAAEVLLTVEKNAEILWESRTTPYHAEGADALPHPPFYFGQVPYEKGSTLRAKGFDQTGTLLIEETRQTAGEAHHINLSVDTLGIPMQADGNDLVFVRAEVVDRNGTLCTAAEQPIFFTVEGDAEIVGNGNLLAATNPAWAEAGIASIYIRAGMMPGKIKVTATAKDLVAGETELTTIPSIHETLESQVVLSVNKKEKASVNLSQHLVEGAIEHVSTAVNEKNIYPESILLKGSSRWQLMNKTYFQMDCQVVNGDEDAELLIYLDDVLRWKGQAGFLKLNVEGSKTLHMEIVADQPTEMMLLSPYFWCEKLDEVQTELSTNIAFGKPAKATVNTNQAENIWQDGSWFGQNPREGLQEWQVDLGKLYNVRNAKVLVGGQMGSDCTFYRYEIHTSVDQKNWIKQSENHRTSWTNGVLDYFTAQNVRHVKVTFKNVDGRLFAGIQEFEIYEDYGVDNVNEYALSGIVVKDNILVFNPNCLEYHLPEQTSLTIQALTFDPKATLTISGNVLEQPINHEMTAVVPLTIERNASKGVVDIMVSSASGKGSRTYKIYF